MGAVATGSVDVATGGVAASAIEIQQRSAANASAVESSLANDQSRVLLELLLRPLGSRWGLLDIALLCGLVRARICDSPNNHIASLRRRDAGDVLHRE